MLYKFTKHALERFYVRAGICPLTAHSKLQQALEKSVEITKDRVKELFAMQGHKKYRYLMWSQETIRNELMLAIIDKNTVVTVVTENNINKKRKREMQYAYRNLD